MKFSIKLVPDIIDFDLTCGKKLDDYLNKIKKHIHNADKLENWQIVFILLLCMPEKRADSLALFKKGATFTSENRKSYSIHVPAPSDKDIHWGIPGKKFVSCYIPPIDKERIILLEDVDYKQCNSLEDYIVASGIKGINRNMSNGISLQGYKWKYDDKKDSYNRLSLGQRNPMAFMRVILII